MIVLVLVLCTPLCIISISNIDEEDVCETKDNYYNSDTEDDVAILAKFDNSQSNFWSPVFGSGVYGSWMEDELMM